MEKVVVMCIFIVLNFKTCESITNNLALSKQTRQSTTYAGSELAVDGDLTVWVGSDFNCAHTHHYPPIWWAVDLGDVYTVSDILIYGRTDCCQKQLQNFDVEVIMPPECSCDKWTTFHRGRAVNCHYQMDGTTFLNITCPENTTVIVLCEVQVFGQLCPVVTVPATNTFKTCGYNGHMYNGTHIQKTVARSKLECVGFCRQTGKCCAAEFSAVTQECILKSKADALEETTHSLLDDPSKITYLV